MTRISGNNMSLNLCRTESVSTAHHHVHHLTAQTDRQTDRGSSVRGIWGAKSALLPQTQTLATREQTFRHFRSGLYEASETLGESAKVQQG